MYEYTHMGRYYEILVDYALIMMHERMDWEHVPCVGTHVGLLTDVS